VALLLFFTAFLLILIKYNLQKIIRIIILASLFLSYIYVFTGILLIFQIGMSFVMLAAMILSCLVMILLSRFPEWFVIDVLSVPLAGGIASIFGISLEPLPVIVLLTILAIYDEISVYQTKHMLTLADGVLAQKVPIMVIAPKKRGYSFIKEDLGFISPKNENAEMEQISPRPVASSTQSNERSFQSTNQPLKTSTFSPNEVAKSNQRERSAYFMGLGDLIMPTILVVSAAVFVPGKGIGIFSLCSLTTLIGSLIGLLGLMLFVNKGVAHAGLPPLNGGAVIGFFIGVLFMQMI
jgi:presenilin-like A22 family membrane protease